PFSTPPTADLATSNSEGRHDDCQIPQHVAHVRLAVRGWGSAVAGFSTWSERLRWSKWLQQHRRPRLADGPRGTQTLHATHGDFGRGRVLAGGKPQPEHRVGRRGGPDRQDRVPE